MGKVVFENVEKTYDNGFLAVKGINLEILDKKFTVIVGPSGCGKTTTLRMIAGLEEVTSGKIYIDDVMVNNISPKDRNIAMVFQNYALYPHMTVYENMAFGLRLRRYPKKEIDERVRSAAEVLGITKQLEKKPKMLSGGQSQRVAVGRAIVRKPNVFLFDEPLSNLDAKMRVQMRTELQKLHNKLKTTMIYVTHDQMEAMTMGDQIVVMNNGNVIQIADPITMYNFPKNKFVAGFIGSPAMNFMNGKIVKKGKDLFFTNTDGVQLQIFKHHIEKLENYVDKEIIFGFRPEHVNDKIFVPDAKINTIIKATVDVVEPMGSEIYIYFKTKSNSFIGKLNPKVSVKLGDIIELVIDMEMVHFFDKETEDTII